VIGSALLSKVTKDVVNHRSHFTLPPASIQKGCIRDGHAYGRGTLDVKYTVAAMMEAASFLKKRNFRPRRTVLFAFGHDEEVGGEAFHSRITVIEPVVVTLILRSRWSGAYCCVIAGKRRAAMARS
jgi:hypothetical protein